MDDNGYWHHRNAPEIEKHLKNDRDERTQPPERFVISFEIGSTVVVKRDSNGEEIVCVFERAEKNKVTLRRIEHEGKTPAYLSLAERVNLSDGSGNGVSSQVWDNRGGKLILRTLPVQR